jgi:1-deoxy-D-xylulose-5-phosphate reductoisomerase
LPAEQIKVLIHPQSVIHSMVRYVDGSVIAQLGQPDMKTPIAYGLGWPNRIDGGVEELDFMKLGQLHFEEVDSQKFPSLKLAYQALSLGGLMPTVLNAANEVAVEAFLMQKIKFTQIADVVEKTLEQFSVSAADQLDAILAIDQESRTIAHNVMKGY